MKNIMENIHIEIMLKVRPMIEPGHDEYGIFDKRSRPFYISHMLFLKLVKALNRPFTVLGHCKIEIYNRMVEKIFP